MRQHVEIAKLTIRKGETESEPTSLHQDAAIVTVYSTSPVPAYIYASHDGKAFLRLKHKGTVVQVHDGASNIPIPACKSLKIVSMKTDEDREFELLSLMELP